MKTFTHTTIKEQAFTDIVKAFVQIRTGGLTYGMLSIKDMIELVYDIRKHSKDAWILNYTNPAAIISYALKREFPDDDRIYVISQLILC